MALAAFLDQYSAESRATKMSANSASTRGLPDSRTTASVNSLRVAIIRSRSPHNFTHRSRMGNFAQSRWTRRPRETISGNDDAGVLSKCPSTSPVAGLIEGSVSIGMAVAAIIGILTDFEVGRWLRHSGSGWFYIFFWGRTQSSLNLGVGVRAFPRATLFRVPPQPSRDLEAERLDQISSDLAICTNGRYPLARVLRGRHRAACPPSCAPCSEGKNVRER